METLQTPVQRISSRKTSVSMMRCISILVSRPYPPRLSAWKLEGCGGTVPRLTTNLEGSAVQLGDRLHNG